jgi:hypothetical protein
MSSISIRDSAPAVSIADITAVEQEFGFELPDALRNFYRDHNGGVPVRPRFRSGEDDYVLNEFFPIKHGREGLRLEDTALVLRRAGFFPDHLVAFAGDPGGDFFCVSTRREDFGSIYFYRNDYYDDPARAVVPMFPKFEDLLSALSR